MIYIKMITTIVLLASKFYKNFCYISGVIRFLVDLIIVFSKYIFQAKFCEVGRRMLFR